MQQFVGSSEYNTFQAMYFEIIITSNIWNS